MTMLKLPLINTVIMAGGQGKRLLPLTATIPKPMLIINDKPVLEYLIEHLCLAGIQDITLSVGYLGEQIKEYFGNGSPQNVNLQYIDESSPLGSIGVLSQVENWPHEYFLVINGDIVTNFDVENLLSKCIEMQADMVVATYEYHLSVPWGVLTIDTNKSVSKITEKPVISQAINAGIYLFKKDLLSLFPNQERYEGWQLLRDAIENGYEVKALPIDGYWLDIGDFKDFEKANTLLLKKTD